MNLMIWLAGCCGGSSLSNPESAPPPEPTPPTEVSAPPGAFVDDRPFRHDQDVDAAAFFHDDSVMVTAMSDRLFLWDLTTREQTARMKSPCKAYTSVRSLAVAPAGTHLVVGCGYDQSPVVIENATGVTTTLALMGSEVVWGSDDVIAVRSSNLAVLYDGATLKELTRYELSYSSTVQEVGGHWIIDQVKASPDEQTVCWTRDGEQWRVEAESKAAHLGLQAVVLVGWRERRIHDLATGDLLGDLDVPFKTTTKVLGGREGVWASTAGGMTLIDADGVASVHIPARVEDITRSPSGSWLLHIDGRIPALYSDGGEPQMDQGVWSASGPQQLIATAGKRFTVTVAEEEIVWSDRELGRSSRALVDSASAVALRADGVAFVGGEELIRIGADGEVTLLSTEIGEIGSLGFTPSGDFVWVVATESKDPTILLVFDAATGEQRHAQFLFESEGDEVVAALDPSGDLVVAGADGRLFVQPLPSAFR